MMIEDAGSLVDIFNVAGALVLSSFYCFQIFQVENKIPIDVEEYVAEAEAAADGCGFALVGRQTISRNHDSRKLA